MAYRELLLDIGLSKWESQTYLALLELGSTTTGALIQKSEVPQSKIYGVLDSLIKKGLVSYIIKGKIKYFQASNPKRILDLFRDKEKRIEVLIEELKSKQSEKKQSSELFEGLKAIRGMFLGMINEIKKGEDWFGFSRGIDYSDETIEFYNWWGMRKAISGLKDHLLISLQNKKEFERGIDKDSLKTMKKKLLRYSPISFPGDVAIFRDQVVILNWEDKPTAILITSKNLSRQYKDFFLGLWKIAKP